MIKAQLAALLVQCHDIVLWCKFATLAAAAVVLSVHVLKAPRSLSMTSSSARAILIKSS